MSSFLQQILTPYTHCDAAEPWQVGFQDPASPVVEGIINFHHDLFFFLITTAVFVFWMLFRCVYGFSEERHPVPSKVIHGTTIEIVWTLIPAIILFIVAIPSFALLYSVDEIIDPFLTIKVVGHQWYWSYEYAGFMQYSEDENIGNVNFNSYMVPTEDLTKGQLRLLEVDNYLYLPSKTHLQVIVTSSDVIHCWAIPSLGLKLDACPGRLNQVSLFIDREGLFYGQCSEICGVNHGFMPIVVEAKTLENYLAMYVGLAIFQMESSD